MLGKLFQKNGAQQPPPRQQPDEVARGKNEKYKDINPTVTVHYGIPATASILALDPIQSLLAIATLDGRIKVIGGDNIEGLFVSPKQVPFKNLEFLQNQGFLVSVTAENEIQVWDLEQRTLASTLRWESSITALSVISGSSYMFLGDEYGMVSVLKFDVKKAKLLQLPYYVPTESIADASGLSSPNCHSVVGLLPQPATEGNRLLIAYDDGLIILWDVSEDKVILTKGNRDLQLKSKTAAEFHAGLGNELSDDTSSYEYAEKEISALCWASGNGSVLAVGYVDGDILFWNLSTAGCADEKSEKSSNDVVKLQLSSADRRLPVIVLHWSADSLRDDCHGQLFVYGGDAIGSEEVLTILSIDMSSGIENVKCMGRVDLTLNGAYADMVLLRSDGLNKSRGTLVLTNPGQLHFYDDASFASLISQQQKKNAVPSMQYPMVIPIVEPYMTVGRLASARANGKFSKALSETVSAAKLQEAHARRSMNWPLTGGVPSQPHDAENYQVEQVYMAGYQDGSVRIWDATSPTFTHIYVLEPESKGINIGDTSASVSALEFCSFTLTVAIGNEVGMVRLYTLFGRTNEASLHLVKETEKEVHTLHQGDGPKCSAVFSFSGSPVCNLQFANFGCRLVVGFHCGKVAMLDTSTFSVLFLTDCVSSSMSPVKSLSLISVSDAISSVSNPEDAEAERNIDHVNLDVFAVTKDAHFLAIDGNSGSIISSQSLQSEKKSNVISMYITEGGCLISDISSEKQSVNLTQDTETNREPEQGANHHKTSYSRQRIENFLLLLCFEDQLQLYSLKSLNEGGTNPIRMVNLLEPCCWTSTFKMNDKEYGLIVLYQNGVMELRSLSDLEVVGENSLMSILRWNFKTNMEKTICSCDTAEIMLVNACEFASISFWANANSSRIAQSLPCLHDKVLAAAADAAMSLSSTQSRIQAAPSGILGGLIKGLQGPKTDHSIDHPEVHKNEFTDLERIFSTPPFLKPDVDIPDNQKVLELNIDDINIDEPVIVSSSSTTTKKDTKDKGTERERLFEGSSGDLEPRLRTAEEIKAKYRKEDPAAAASRAREKLGERGQKLERLSERTEELQSGAENFASMAKELAKQMEKRKWWNL